MVGVIKGHTHATSLINLHMYGLVLECDYWNGLLPRLTMYGLVLE